MRTANRLIENDIFKYPIFERSPRLTVELAILSYEPILLKEEASTGLTAGLAKDALRYAIKAAAEYGIGTLTMPAGFAGVALGPASETALDAMFAAGSVASLVANVKTATSSAGEFSDLFNSVLAAKDALIKSPQQFYQIVRKIIKKSLSMLGAGVTGKIDEYVKKLKEVVVSMIEKTTNALIKGVQLIIPEATVDTTVGAVIRTALSTLANNSFSVLSKMFSLAGDFGKFLLDPEATKTFFTGLFASIVELLNSVAKKVDERGMTAKILMGVSGNIGAEGAEIAMKKLASFISSNSESLISLMQTVIKVVIPVSFALTAIFQILVNEEYKDNSPAAALEDPTGGGIDSGASPAASTTISESRLRKIISDTLLSEHHRKNKILR